MFGLTLGLSAALIVCLICVCVFEFVNGFHDTANAVATVIYTNSLRPKVAVILSGILNGIGVFAGGTAVAVGIVNMLPVETLVDQDIQHSLGMVGAILATAIFWNLGTWLLAIPASSSHTLVGSILGVGIAYSLLPGTGEAAVNWHKAGEVGLSLLISPVFGFVLAICMMGFLAILFRKNTTLFQTPVGDTPPPLGIRMLLILTCGLVSFSHGSNDGQKGIGLMMLLLIGIIPAKFALDERVPLAELDRTVVSLQEKLEVVKKQKLAPESDEYIRSIEERLKLLQSASSTNTSESRGQGPFEVRRTILLLREDIHKLSMINEPAMAEALGGLAEGAKSFRRFTDYAPFWVIVLISVSLGVGTMIGWKRIVVTVGEKIGKSHLTYAQGASAEVVAASTIAVSTFLGLPVSTTHVLSSGIAGSMFASGGIGNLDRGTVSKILLAWFLTFPVCLTMAGTLFLLFRYITG
jgi:PiT family inorganic phosphate transporter